MKVGIQNKEGRLILVWDDGKRRTMAVGMPDSSTGRALAEKTKAEIEWDWRIGQYDGSLLKYRPRRLGKNGSELSTVELFDKFTKHQQRAKGLAQSTIDNKYGAVRRMLEKYLGCPAEDVDRRRTEAFADKCDEVLSPEIAKARVWLLKAAWHWAGEKSICHLPTENPWNGISERWLRAQKPKPKKALTKDEVGRILEGFKTSPYYSYYADFVSFQLNMATRPGETIGLKWDSVSEDCSQVWVGEGYYRGHTSGTKTREARTLAVPLSTRAMLLARKERLKPGAEDYVFPARQGGPISDGNFRRRAWAKVLAAVGVPYRSPYVTRKSNLNYAYRAGANPADLARAAGHSIETANKHYLEAMKEGPILFDFGAGDGGGDHD
jgi:integrase